MVLLKIVGHYLIEIVEVVGEGHGLVRPQGLHCQDDSLVPRRRQLRYVLQPRLEDAVEKRLLRLEENLENNVLTQYTCRAWL